LIVQAGTLSTRSRGEQPSFNVLRLHRPEIEVSRFAWDERATQFTMVASSRYRHSDRGWSADEATADSRS
jgi:hypothetical protein